MGVSAAGRMVMLKDCIAELPTPLLAVMTPVKVPACVAVPVIVPADESVSPGGRLPDVTEKVGDGKPVAVSEKLEAMPEPAVAEIGALVIAGAWSTAMVKPCVADGVVPLLAVTVPV